MCVSKLLVFLCALPIGIAMGSRHDTGSSLMFQQGEVPNEKSVHGIGTVVGSLRRAGTSTVALSTLAVALVVGFLILRCFGSLQSFKKEKYGRIRRRLSVDHTDMCSSDEEMLIGETEKKSIPQAPGRLRRAFVAGIGIGGLIGASFGAGFVILMNAITDLQNAINAIQNCNANALTASQNAINALQSTTHALMPTTPTLTSLMDALPHVKNFEFATKSKLTPSQELKFFVKLANSLSGLNQRLSRYYISFQKDKLNKEEIETGLKEIAEHSIAKTFAELHAEIAFALELDNAGAALQEEIGQLHMNIRKEYAESIKDMVDGNRRALRRQQEAKYVTPTVAKTVEAIEKGTFAFDQN